MYKVFHLGMCSVAAFPWQGRITFMRWPKARNIQADKMQGSNTCRAVQLAGGAVYV